MAEPTTSGDEIMSLLMGENEDVEDEKPVVEAVLSLDDVTVEVDQYALAETPEDGDEAPPESFEFISSSGPTLSQTVASTHDEEEHHLTPDDMPSTPVKFEIDSVDPLDEVAEPVHTGKGGLFSPSIATPTDDDLLGSVGPNPADATPDLPDLPDEVVATPSLAQATAAETQVPTPDLPDTVVEAASPAPDAASQTPAPQAAVAAVATPLLPDLPEDDTVAEPVAEVTPAPTEAAHEDSATPPHDPNRIWPWPKAEAWGNAIIYQEVVKAMEFIKQGQMEAAAATLDTLGPHLDLNLDMLLHISVLMQHLGRHDHVKWTLDMAAYVYPADPHVQQARAQLLA